MDKYTTIGFFYRNIAKQIFFKLDPEFVHDEISMFGKFLGQFWITRRLVEILFRFESPKLEQKVLGIRFPNPVGLSAGFDKDANLINILKPVGFGFAQIGSVTNQPYQGNPKPRLTRLPNSKALAVYYGLKNIGVDKVINRLKNLKSKGFPISISIAKTNSSDTNTTETGIQDYYNCFEKLVSYDTGDFYTINISCPNTFGGEPFTTPDKLDMLLKKLSIIKTEKPIFIKMPINLLWREFNELLKVVIKYKIAGVVIGNLNKESRSYLIKDNLGDKTKGGISGKPTWELSNDLISKTFQTYGDKIIIIGVGGIFSAEDAYEKIKRGATLVQLITGMIYQGPQLIGEINKGIVKLLKNDGYTNISQAIGSHYKANKGFK